MTDSFDYSELVHAPDPSTAPATADAPDPALKMNVLEALHVYQAAEAAMRRRTGGVMGLGDNDLLALQFILDNRAAGRTTASKDVTRYLGISSASTTVLLHRLEESGHIERIPSTVDRRSIEIFPTAVAEGDTGPMLAASLQQMAGATEAFTPEEARIIVRFLTTMRETVDRIGRTRTE